MASPPPDHHRKAFFHEDIPFLIPEHRLAAWVAPDLSRLIEERDDRGVEFEPEPDRYSVLRLGGHCTIIGGQDR